MQSDTNNLTIDKLRVVDGVYGTNDFSYCPRLRLIRGTNAISTIEPTNLAIIYLSYRHATTNQSRALAAVIEVLS